MTTRLITRFADDMARELDANCHKSGWEYMTVRQCLVRAEQEIGELRRAIERNESFETIRSEAANVGNFLAMLVWNACVASKNAAPAEVRPTLPDACTCNPPLFTTSTANAICPKCRGTVSPGGPAPALPRVPTSEPEPHIDAKATVDFLLAEWTKLAEKLTAARTALVSARSALSEATRREEALLPEIVHSAVLACADQARNGVPQGRWALDYGFIIERGKQYASRLDSEDASAARAALPEETRHGE